jgi:hypothetical protein
MENGFMLVFKHLLLTAENGISKETIQNNPNQNNKHKIIFQELSTRDKKAYTFISKIENISKVNIYKSSKQIYLIKLLYT